MLKHIYYIQQTDVTNIAKCIKNICVALFKTIANIAFSAMLFLILIILNEK